MNNMEIGRDKIEFEVEDIHVNVEVMCCDKDKFNAYVEMKFDMELERAKDLLAMFPEFHTAKIKIEKTEPKLVNRR